MKKFLLSTDVVTWFVCLGAGLIQLFMEGGSPAYGVVLIAFSFWPGAVGVKRYREIKAAARGEAKENG